VTNNKLYAHLAVLGANLIYGINYTVAKGVMPEFIAPFAFILIRVVVTAIIFTVIDLFIKSPPIERKDLIKLAMCALFGIAINQLMFFKGLSITSPINAALMMTTNPIMVLIVAAIVIREKITAGKVGGILIGITGAITLILFGNHFNINGGDVKGDIMVLINSLSFGVFLIIVKPMMQKYHAITVMKWIFIFGIFYVFPFGYTEFRQTDFLSFPTHIWLSVAFVVIVTTSIAYSLNTYALKNLSASNVSSYIYLQPLFATLFAILMGKDQLHFLHIISSGLIFTGVYLISASPYKKEPQKS
jgi:drug/metabolite transporter (DMT)-like permease